MAFIDEVQRMLLAALHANAEMRSLQIGDDAANFFVNRALTNIKRGVTLPRDIFNRAVGAVQTASLFLECIARKKSAEEELNTAAEASAIIDKIKKDCVYPWCKDSP